MKRLLNIITILFLSFSGFSQLNIVNSQPVANTSSNSQSNIIKIKLTFTAFVGNNTLVDNYLCYNGENYYLFANKTSNPSDKSVIFILGTTKESSVKSLNDLKNIVVNGAMGSTVTVVMCGKKHTIEKTDQDILSFSSEGVSGIWLLDKSQINLCLDHLTANTSQETIFKGGSGIGVGSGSGIGSGLGPGTGFGSGAGIGTGTGSGLGPGEGSGSSGGIGYGTGSRGLVHQINTPVNGEGQVCVEVHVMADGTVSEARIINNNQHKTTITNPTIQQQCVQESKRAKYKPGKEELRIIVFH